MHSSRMRTARLFPVSHCSRGVYLVRGGVPGPGWCTWSRGVYLVPGGVPGPGGCTWSQGSVPGRGGVPGPGGGVPGPRGGVPGLVNRILDTRF